MVSTGGYNYKLHVLLIYKFSCFFGPQVAHAFQYSDITMKVGEWCDSPDLIHETWMLSCNKVIPFKEKIGQHF